MMYHWYGLSLNPEPWTVSVGMGKVYKPAGLAAYQNAVRDGLKQNYPNVVPIEGPVALRFFFWRQRPDYTGKSGRVRKHQADLTNMQKALEDAIQGVLIGNDRDVIQMHSFVVDQGPQVDPFVLIHVARPDATPHAARALRRSIEAKQRPVPNVDSGRAERVQEVF